MPASSSESTAFGQLDERIRRWIWAEGWTQLRDIQEHAIPALLPADRDVIIAAATATGKTEAAFFPILSHLLAQPSPGCVIYISPLKALINDQWERLDRLCEALELPVIAWHGDSKVSAKQHFLKHGQGIVLMTPESLEALFVNRGSAVPGLLAGLRYLVVDELHAFIGSERGKQLQSLLHRAERAAGRRIPRVGLSATLGDMRQAALFLRPQDAEAVQVIVSTAARQELKILLKGYVEPVVAPVRQTADPEAVDPSSVCELAIAAHLYKALRHSNNLVFPNSRRQVEAYADHLRRCCDAEGVANVFWPHHGSLSRELREHTERALKDRSRPATAICTTTLELGIDLGAVKSVAQIGPPPSVASLRQRLGRSGRRPGEAAILRAFNIEPEITAHSAFSDRIHESLLQSIAMIRLLLAGWCEPAQAHGLHASTLVQQILSVVAEKGGVSAARLWQTLVENGPFDAVRRDDFLTLLHYLGELDLLVQDSAGLLLPGERGEKLINHYTFYASFEAEEEYRVECQGKVLGTLPLSRPLLPDQGLIFAGRGWRVLDVDEQARKISVLPDKGGAPPAFDSGGIRLHDRVRQEMQALLAGDEAVIFLDDTAQALLAEARTYYREAGLHATPWLTGGEELLWLTWRGDAVNNTLALILNRRGLKATAEGVAIAVRGATPEELPGLLRSLRHLPVPDVQSLLVEAKNLQQEKWDWALPEALLFRSYASSWLDVPGAMAVLQGI